MTAAPALTLAHSQTLTHPQAGSVCLTLAAEDVSVPIMFLASERIGLRALDKADIGPRYLGWLQDRDVTQFLETGAFPLTLDDLHRYYAHLTSQTASPPACVFLAIQHLATGEHIGNIKLEPIHWLHRTATLGLVIGDKRFHGQGLGEEAARLCLRYAFERLGLRKVSLGVLASNTRAFQLYRRLGFVIEGCKRQEYWADGAYHDAHIMGLFAHEYLKAAGTPLPAEEAQ
jgi:ribosomal-protein-alanine N-acetyltransferase